MIVAIHQPDYIPWLGLYYKRAHCDKFVYLDNAQFSNTAAHNFNEIKTSQGAFRLKIPVQQKMGDLIMEVRTKDELGWKDKHLKTLIQNYRRAKYFIEIFPIYEEVIRQNYDNLSELNIAINKFICKGFNIHPQIFRSSDMPIRTTREQRILDICSIMGADEYLSGNGARNYQNDEHFTARGIKLTYIDYKPIEYLQLWGKFLPCMSVLDYIFNCGFDWSYVEEQVKALQN